MTQALQIAKHNLLSTSEINESHLEKYLKALQTKHIDYADVYMQNYVSESWSLGNGIVKSGSFNIDRGFGMRAISNDKTGLAYSNEISNNTLLTAVKSVRNIGMHNCTGPLLIDSTRQIPQLYGTTTPLDSLSSTEKVQLLQNVNDLARKDPRISEVRASLTASYSIILMFNSNMEMTADVRPLVRLNVSVIAKSGQKIEHGTSGGGGRYDYQEFLKNDLWKHFTNEAVRIATTNLDAVDAPAGTMDVVLGAGWPGVLIHEAIGHGLEADHIRKRTSAFSDLLGKKIASPICTIVDDGTLAKRRGSLNVDDEGTPTQCTTLVEKGILKNFMADRLNAKLMNIASTGNGRRESYADMPIPRMTNTYMLAGETPAKEIIESVKNGIYAVNFSGGQVDTTSGKFVFVISEGYLIKNGKITKPIKGASIVGDGPSALSKISMVGDDLALDAGVGICGKMGQSVPVGVGQPTLRINDLTVGGSAAS